MGEILAFPNNSGEPPGRRVLSGPINLTPPAGSGPVPAEPIDNETHEVRVYKRNVLQIIPELTHCDPDRVRAWEDRGYCFVEFPAGIELVSFRGISWWNVLRQVYADLMRRGIVANPLN